MKINLEPNGPARDYPIEEFEKAYGNASAKAVGIRPKRIGPTARALERERELESKVQHLERLIKILLTHGRASLAHVENETTLGPKEWADLERLREMARAGE